MKKEFLIFSLSLALLLVSGCLEQNFKKERPDGGFSKPVDESSLRTVGNATFSVNSVIVDFNEGVTREIVEDVAKSVNGTIVGFYPASNTYAFELQTTTVAELDNVINQLEADPRVNNAVEDSVPELEEE